MAHTQFLAVYDSHLENVLEILIITPQSRCSKFRISIDSIPIEYNLKKTQVILILPFSHVGQFILFYLFFNVFNLLFYLKLFLISYLIFKFFNIF